MFRPHDGETLLQRESRESRRSDEGLLRRRGFHTSCSPQQCSSAACAASIRNSAWSSTCAATHHLEHDAPTHALILQQASAHCSMLFSHSE